MNSHLAAHTEYVLQRNKNQQDIEAGMIFNYPDGDRTIDDHKLILTINFVKVFLVISLPLHYFRYVIWMGDLNYRLNYSIDDCPPREQFLKHGVKFMDIVTVRDQLYTEKWHHRTFDGYEEGPIKFKPTFKYDVNTNTFDTRYNSIQYIFFH